MTNENSVKQLKVDIQNVLDGKQPLLKPTFERCVCKTAKRDRYIFGKLPNGLALVVTKDGKEVIEKALRTGVLEKGFERFGPELVYDSDIKKYQEEPSFMQEM